MIVRLTIDVEVPEDHAAASASSWLVRQYGADTQPERSPEGAVEAVLLDVIYDTVVDDEHELFDGWAIVSSHSGRA